MPDRRCAVVRERGGAEPRPGRARGTVGAGHYSVAMLIGAHVREEDPVATAAARGADVVQMFLSDPQGWKKPPAHPQADRLREGPLRVVVHAPYVVNLASLNNRIRIPSRKIVEQHAAEAANVGAMGLVVHGGHVTAGDEDADGVATTTSRTRCSGAPSAIACATACSVSSA